jgi:hypothetical protein
MDGVYTRRFVEGSYRCHFFAFGRIAAEVYTILPAFPVNAHGRGEAMLSSGNFRTPRRVSKK